MLKIKIVCVGDFKEKYLKDARDEYEKRISRFFSLETLVLKETGKEKESQQILEKINGHTILLDISGEQIDSLQFAQNISSLTQTESKITFIIGGSDGVLDDVRKKVKQRISFGKITLPHQLARIILLEQIYRAGTIISGNKYHK